MPLVNREEWWKTNAVDANAPFIRKLSEVHESDSDSLDPAVVDQESKIKSSINFARDFGLK